MMTNNDTIRYSAVRYVSIFILVALAVLYGYCIVTVWHVPYAPVGSDEYHYVLEAKSACYNGTWHSPFTLYERVAKVGDFGFHGFMYNALHGTVARLAGYNPTNVVFTNVGLLACALLVFFISRTMPAAHAALASALILLCFVVPVYTFTYMQENVHVLCAVVAWVLLHGMARQPAGEHRWTIGYYALLIVATLFRPQWALWTVAAVPLARTRRERIIFVLIVLASPALAYVMMQCFCAPYPLHNWFFQDAVSIVRSDGILAVVPAAWKRFTFNVWNYFAGYKIGVADFWIKYLFVALTAYLLWCGIRQRSRLALAAAVTALVNLVVLWGAFDAVYWTDHRMLCASTVLLLLTLVAEGAPWARWVVLAVLLALAPDTMRIVRGHIAERRRVGALQHTWRDKIEAFQRVAALITNEHMTTILLSSKLYQHYDVTLPALPIRTKSGFPLRYTVNLFHPNDLQRFGLLDVHYVITPDMLTGMPYRLVYACPYYRLYRSAGPRERAVAASQRNLLANGAFAEGLLHWSLMGDTNNIRIVKAHTAKDPPAWVRIENPAALITGVRQTIPVVSGAVYRLRGTARSCSTNGPVLFGGRISFETRPCPPQYLIWMTEYTGWWQKEVVVTSDMDGAAYIEVTMGYGAVSSTGEFTDIYLEQLTHDE